MKVITDLKSRLTNALLYLNNAKQTTRSSSITYDLDQAEKQINKVLEVLKNSKAMNKVLCSQCCTLHIPYSHKEEEYDINELDELREDIERYPSTVTDDEIFINYPLCRTCHIEELGDPASWDEEFLSTLYILEEDKK